MKLKIDKHQLLPYFPYIPPMLMILGVILLGVFVIFPSAEKIMTARKTLQKNREHYAAVTEKIMALQQIEEVSLNQKIGKLDQLLPREKAIPGLLAGLEKMAQEASASVESFDIKPGIVSSASAETNDTLDFQINLKGNYDGLKAFLTKIKNSGRLMGVKNIEFTNSTKEKDSIVSSALRMYVYYRFGAIQMGEISKPLPKITSEDEKLYEKLSGFEIYTLPPNPVPVGKTNPFLKY